MGLHETCDGSQLSHAVLTPADALYFPASQLSHAVLTPAAALNFTASQLVQTLDPAIYVHTLSQTTLCKFLHLNISR